ncbi:hypothetical protein ABZP36_015821 [Zizania latifolia]
MAIRDNTIGVLFVFTFVCAACANAEESGSGGIFDITKLGAVADGKTDSTKALQDAWAAACGAAGQQTVLIPKGDFLTGPLNFTGPCKGYVAIQLDGTLLGSNNLEKYNGSNWVEILRVDNIVITGSGTLDGQGAAVWSDDCKIMPNSLVLDFVNNGTVSGIKLVNAKFFHINIYKSKVVTVKNVTISAPANTSNTDGVHIGDSSEITVADATIGTGDDCISVGAGSERINIQGVTCGPGQGISIGCLGKFKLEKDVRDITVRDCVLRNTTNGVRIKSHEEVLSPLVVSRVAFENIKMEGVANPIIIDQKYCPENACVENRKNKNQVTIKDVTFRNITGTSTTPEAVSLLCSERIPCNGIELLDVNVEYAGKDNKTMAVCHNAKGLSKGSLQALACL